MQAEAPVLERVTALVSQLELPPGGRVTLHQISGQELEAILAALGENRAARLSYYNGDLEIRMPGPDHEKSNRVITDIVKLLLDRQQRPYEDFGSTTLGVALGSRVEPDTGFYIQNYQQVYNRRQWQVGDPPHDLVIETDVTSKTTMDAYATLRVPEVWVYSRPQLTIYRLQEEEYRESEISPTFPDLPLRELIPQVVERAWEVGRHQAFLELRQLISVTP